MFDGFFVKEGDGLNVLDFVDQHFDEILKYCGFTQKLSHTQIRLTSEEGGGRWSGFRF
jgi:hypothetical protein